MLWVVCNGQLPGSTPRKVLRPAAGDAMGGEGRGNAPAAAVARRLEGFGLVERGPSSTVRGWAADTQRSLEVRSHRFSFYPRQIRDGDPLESTAAA